MDKKDEAFLKRLIATFKVEAAEHVAKMYSGLLELEKAPAERRMEIIEDVFREAHSMKGAARAVNLTDIESLCRAMETVFASLKRHEISLTRDLSDMLYAVADFLGKLVESAESASFETPASEASVIRELIRKLESGAMGHGQEIRDREPGIRGQETGIGEWKAGTGKTMKEEPIPGPQSPIPVFEPQQHAPLSEIPEPRSPGPAALVETTRISKAKLDSIFFQAEGLLSAKLAAGQRCTELKEINSGLSVSRKGWEKVRSDARALRTSLEKGIVSEGRSKNSNLTNLIEFVETNEDFVRSLHAGLTALEKSLEQDRRSLAAMVDGLLEDVKNAAMFPFSSLLEIFPKIVRDLCHSQGKEAELVVRGGEIEIDRRILEELKDPLIHLVRNCIDHGIEKSEERLAKRKSRAGTVTIAISHLEGKKAELLITDDGLGIDICRIRTSAVKAGILSVTDADTIEDEKIIPLIFQSGVTTSPIITDISGRGLGLAIVMEKVEKLRGVVSCVSCPGAGTTFRIELPLSLATFRGVLVRTGEHIFVLPTAHLERVVRVRRDEIKTVENRETISLSGRTIPLVYLNAVLGLPVRPEKAGEKEFIQAAVLSSAKKSIAAIVDEIVNEQEVLLKGLGRQLSRVRNVAGSTVLGNGKVVPVLNVADLMKSAIQVSYVSGKPAPVQEAPAGRRSILVVEDSITARTLLKNILEVSGYDVQTAVDGIDGLTALRTGEFDLVVSDVDMPRMNGFDLTAKIRSDKKFSELPVILVTALESREDREHGIDAGANAYIVKSSFDQSNLLEVIGRLI